MSIAFGALLAMLIQDRLKPAWGRAMLGPLVVLSVASVAYWARTLRIHPGGDLRAYALVQFGTLLAVSLICLLFRQRRYRNRTLVWALIYYGLAKAFETWDVAILHATAPIGGISGHSLKHIASAIAPGLLLRDLRRD